MDKKEALDLITDSISDFQDVCGTIMVEHPVIVMAAISAVAQSSVCRLEKKEKDKLIASMKDTPSDMEATEANTIKKKADWLDAEWQEGEAGSHGPVFRRIREHFNNQ